MTFKASVWLFGSVVLHVGSLGLTGCASGTLHERDVEALWRALSDAHPNIEVIQDFSGFTQEAKAAAAQISDERDFLILLARSIDWLGDPHLCFLNLDDYWKSKTGHELQSVRAAVALGDRRMWIQFDPSEVRNKDAADNLPSQVMYELVSVEGVRTTSLALQLLRAEAGREVHMKVVDADGQEHSVTLVASEISNRPQIASTAPATAPFARSQPSLFKLPIGYIRLSRLDSDDVFETFDKSLNAHLDARAIIIDLRDNPGGNSAVTAAIVGRFITGTQPYAYLQMRATGQLLGPLKFPLWYTFPMLAQSRGRTFHNPIVVIVNSSSQSAAELLTLGLRDLCGAIVVGGNTQGAGAGIQSVTLPSGLGVVYGRWPIRSLDGRLYQGIGIAPGIRMPLGRREVAQDGMKAIEKWEVETLIRAFEVAAEKGSCQDDPSYRILLRVLQEASQ